jgi:hypothetical protein
MELEEIFQYLGLAATLGLAVYGWRALRGTSSLRGWFLAALLGLTAYQNLAMLLHPMEEFSPYGIFDAWFRHLCFYLGQLCFFIFVNRIIFYRSADRSAPRRNERGALLAFLLLAGLQLAAPHQAHAHHEITLLTGELTPYRFLQYLTAQGAQHILAIIGFLVSLAVLRSQGVYAQLRPEAPKRARLIAPFLIGNASFIMLHVWEFLAESRHLFASLPESAVESIEYAFVFFGLAMFFLGIRRLHENHL